MLALFISHEIGEYLIDESYFVCLKYTSDVESYKNHLEWLQTVMKDDDKFRLVEWRSFYYKAELSQKGLLLIRQRSDVNYVYENYARME